MDAVRQPLRRAGGGEQLVEAAMRASRCQELSVVDLLKKQAGLLPKRAGGGLAEARGGDGLAEAAARRCESSPHTLPPPTPLPTSSSSSSSAAISNTSPPLTSSSPSWKSRRTSPISTFAQTRDPAYMRAARYPGNEVGASSNRRFTTAVKLWPVKQLSALHSRGYTSTWLLPQDVENLPKLPPVSELSYDKEDSSPEIWVPILHYLGMYHEPFPDPPADGSCARSLSTDLFRAMQRDLVKLVAVNRIRGYDLAADLEPGNVLVCIETGRIKLEVVSGNLITDSTGFKGYAAVGVLLRTIISYNGTKPISEDNFNFHDLFTTCLEDERILTDASLLSRFGRLGLTLKISMLVENDLQELVTNFNKQQLHRFFESLPYTSHDLDVFPTDSMHASFKALREEFKEFKTQDRTFERNNLKNAGKDPRMAWILLTGKWLVRLNRNGLMHPPRGFKQSQAIDLMHSHTPLYLPWAQEYFVKKLGWWKTLEMRNYFPKK